jgi:CPA1 family monovalent cation:H+ antiporter
VTQLELIALLIAALGPAMALSHLLGLPASLVLFAMGAAAAFIPGLPAMSVDPQLITGLFLPPVIYAATVRVSFHLLRFTLVPGVLLGFVLTLGTIATAAGGVLYLLPGLPPVSALLIAITVSVFDTRLFHEAKGRPHVPRAIADALKTREMVSRIMVLSAFALAIEALSKGLPDTVTILGSFAYDLAGGAVAGVMIGHSVVWLRQRVDPAPVEIAISLATPYLGAVVAQELGLSVAVVIMTAALVVSAVRIDRETGAPRSTSEARITSMAFWEQASLMLSAALFFLAGWSMPVALKALGEWPLLQVATSAGGVLAIVLALQYVVGFITTFMPPVNRILPAQKDQAGTTKAAAAGVMTWASTRSIVGLVLALSLPATLPDGRPFAERDLILVMAAFTIVGSIVVQGLTLRPAVRQAELGG